MTEALATQEVAMGPLAESLGLLLRLGQLKSFADFYATLGEDGLSPGELSTLILIQHNPGVRQGVVARRLSIKRAHMAKMVASLEAEGLVARRPARDDGRALELRLTRAGQHRLERIMPNFETHERRAARPLNAAEEATLKRLLQKYVGMESTE